MKLTIIPLAILLSATTMAAEAVKLQTPTGTLYGTIEAPSGPGPFPIGLIHAGSGPTGRDGNSAGVPGKNNSLKLLAEALASGGIASLRYDKRGVSGEYRGDGAGRGLALRNVHRRPCGVGQADPGR